MSDETLRQTPLFAAHRRLGAKLAPFGGWEMPIHYGSQVEEHHATRNACGIFDVSHMGQVRFTGPDAARAVQACVTCDIAALADGEQSYAALCNEHGGMIDDLFVARLSADDYLLVVNASTYEGDVDQMMTVVAETGPHDLEFRPCSDEFGMIAVQGPHWMNTLQTVIGPGAWQGMARNRIADITFRQSSLLVSTTGYTGEPGCELLCVPGQTEYLWNALLAAGAKPVGLAARDTLRLEQGYCLSGSDFTAENNPLEARIGWAVCLEREFCGRDAIAAVKAAGGPTRRLTALLPEGRRIPRHGAPILRDGQVVGEITSGGQSPTLNRPIALGYVATEFSKPGQTLQIDLGRGQLIDSTTTRTPFVKIQHGAR